MGQYYKIVNLTKEEYIEPESFKLMEFAWVGNPTTDLLTCLMSADGCYKTPEEESDFGKRESWAGDEVVVVGDYATDGSCLGWLEQKTCYDGEDLYDDAGRMFKDVSKRFEYARPYRYAVNKTKGVYIDRYAGPVQYVTVEDSGNVRVSRIDPLTLLLAVGNGRGGGDYAYHARTCTSDVGTWVGDDIVCDDRKPGDAYSESNIVFTEVESIWQPTAGELIAKVAEADLEHDGFYNFKMFDVEKLLGHR